MNTMNTMDTMDTIFIFDIDHTLIHTNLNKMNSITDLPNDKTYIRPYARKLLKFLIKKKYRIGFWSTGLDCYIKDVLEQLLKPFKNFPIYLLLARKQVNNKEMIIDMQTNKLYPYPYKDNMIVKDINFLLTHDDFKKRFHKNTILIDDMEININANKKRNIYAIKPWYKTMKKDKELLFLMNKIKNKRNITRKKMT